MSLLQLIIIAALQGLTEWLPISSSAHVLLASGYFGVEGRDELLINAMSNIGTLAAMMLYFRKDVVLALRGGIEILAAPVTRRPLSAGGHLALCILVATPIALAAGILYEVYLPQDAKSILRSAYTVASASILFGGLLLWADMRGGTGRKEEDMTLRHAFLIGATQAVAAIIPGTSRSGITMTAARGLGYERAEAARFSMLIGAPILAAAGLYGAIGLLDGSGNGAVTFEDGLIVSGVAFVTGLASIAALMSLLRRTTFLPFVVYRFILGIALILTTPMVGIL